VGASSLSVRISVTRCDLRDAVDRTPSREERRGLVIDTTPITAQITRMIASGTTEQALLTAVAHRFPELTPAELSAALQDATAAAEKRAARRH
jgi:uncharacterized protein (DUF433 family)